MPLVNIKEVGLMDRWGDSVAGAWYNGAIHLVGQAEKAIYPSKLHYIFDTSGNRIAKITAPYPPRGETCVSKLHGNLYSISSTTSNDVWKFDPSIAGNTAESWVEVNSDFTPSIGSRLMAAGLDFNGWFYIFGGWNRSTVYKTQDFLNWTLVGNLPANIDKLSACASFVFNNKIWLIGGATHMANGGGPNEFYESDVDGYVYTFDPQSETFEEIHQDKELFGSIWLDGAADDTYMYVSKGYISTAQFASYSGGTSAREGNNRGLLRSTDGIVWENVELKVGLAFYFERHRACMVNANGTVYIIAGYNANDMWKIE